VMRYSLVLDILLVRAGWSLLAVRIHRFDVC
jgi:hypothetical protein